MHPSIFIWLVYGFWLTLDAYLAVAAIGMRQDAGPHIWQRIVPSLPIIPAFLLPRLPMLHFLNFRSIHPIQGVAGLVLCAAGMFLLVWSRQYLGGNWSLVVTVKKGTN